jgi:hypothetical protein
MELIKCSSTEGKNTLVIDTAVSLTHKILKTGTEKITNYQKLALDIKNICKVNNVSVQPFFISVERVVTKNLLKYLENIDLTKNVLRLGL